MKLARRYRFSASHRLHAGGLGDDENRELYGKCNNPYGHGHNYVLDVVVAGPVDAASGRVTNPGRLDQYVRERIVAVYDHRDLNRDVPDFTTLVPTTENLAFAVQKRLANGWDAEFPGTALEMIRIEETPRNSFEVWRT